jgi:PilZ domain-containing protein
MPEVPMDARSGARVACDLRVLVMVHPSTFGPGVLLNVSLSGALLQTPLDLIPLTQVELEVQGPGLARCSIMASITRRELNQYGVAFRDNRNAAVDKMLRLVQSQTAQPGEASLQQHH